MYAITIFLLVTLFTLFFLVGGIIGWIASSYKNDEYQYSEPLFTHPEFFDNNGNIIPDEIIAVKFTPKIYTEDYYDTDDNEEAEDYGEAS